MKKSRLLTWCFLTFNLTFYSQFCFAQVGGQNGNGGGSIPGELATIEEIQGTLEESSLLIRLWLNSLDRRMNPGLFEYRRPYPALAIPQGADKLFIDNKIIFNDLWDLNIIFKKSSPCLIDSSGQHDGAAISSNPLTICISGFSLSKKLTKLDFKIQTEALVLHEIAHLMGATEDEATSIQTTYMQDMQFVPKDALPIVFERTSAKLRSVAESELSELHNTQTVEKKCKAVYDLRSAFNLMPIDSDIPEIELFNAQERDTLENYSILIGQVWQRFICGQQSNNTTLLVEYKDAFKGKNQIEIRDWLKNLSTSSSWNIPESQVKLSLSLYQDPSDMNKDIEIVSNKLILMAGVNATNSILKPTIIINEN